MLFVCASMLVCCYCCCLVAVAVVSDEVEAAVLIVLAIEVKWMACDDISISIHITLVLLQIYVPHKYVFLY